MADRAITIHAVLCAAAIGCGAPARPLSSTPAAPAEPAIPAPAVPADPASWHMERVADGVHAYLGPPGVTPLVSSNST